MKSSHCPAAATAPVFLARPIWLIGSKNICAPSARASSAVRSVELLSQTTSSHLSPDASNAAQAAALTDASEAAMSFSSLKAGTMIEMSGLLSTARACGERFGWRLSGHKKIEGLS